jgi:hypothetical protein
MSEGAEGSPSGSGRRRAVALAALGALLVVICGLVTVRGPALADEYAYLADAKHFASTGSLHTRFYLAESILAHGHPLKDVHAPGYVLLLGAFMRLVPVPGDYWIAVALNVLCYALSAFLVGDITRALGRGARAAGIAAALYLVLPLFLVFVFWAMAELVLGTAFLFTLWAALRHGHRTRGAVLAGLLFGLTFLIRESVLFGVPAVLAVLSRSRRSAVAFLATAAAFVLLVYFPLSRDRAEGGANLLRPGFSHAFAYDVFVAGELGRFGEAGRLVLERAQRNYRELTQPEESVMEAAPERGVLLLYVFLPLWALGAWPRLSGLERRLLVGLVVGWVALVAALFFVYVIVQYSGYRYLMFLIPAFLPWIAREDGHAERRFQKSDLVPLGLAVAGLALSAGALTILNPFKATRERGAEVARYVEPYLTGQPERVMWARAYDYGLRHYPTEVIIWPPKLRSEFKALEHAVWFDYVVLPVGSNWAEGRAHYERVNAGDPDAPAWIYRRLK